jgi:hypothetical protein
VGVSEDGLSAELREGLRHLTSFERSSASEGERRAAEWIAARLREEGCDARVEQAPSTGGFWGANGLLNGLPALAALWLAGKPRSWLRRLVAFVFGVVGATGIWDDVSGGRQWFRRRALPQRTTHTVVAETGDRDAARTLVLVSHHDSAHCGAVYSPKIPQFAYDRNPESFDRDRHPPIMALVWIGPVLVTVGAALRSTFLLRLGAAFGLSTTVAMADIGRSPISPGANDNLSAVAGLLYVARRLREEPVSGVRVLLVSTGSEESFMEGMQGFGRDHFASLPPEATDFLVLESMGSPVTVIPAGEGMLKMRDYPPAAVADLEAAAREEGIRFLDGIKITLATDALIPLRAGYRVATLASVAEPLKLPSNYHAMTDTVENLDWPTLLTNCRVAERWVRRQASQI